MKKLFVSLALFSVTVGAFAQGSINFQNRTAIGKGRAIYGVSGSNPMAAAQGNDADYSNRDKLTGTAYTAGLFAEKDGAWVLIGTSAFRTTVADAGLLQGVPVLKPDGFKAGSTVNLVLRVWDSKATSWEDVTKDSNAGLARGESLKISYGVGGDNNGSPVLQKNLLDSGLQSFGLYIVPEPSVVALGALGLGALLLRRRK